MYTFVFMWTPALEASINAAEDAPPMPFGEIFACFMVAIMIGSGLFGYLIAHYNAESIAVANFGAAAASLAVVCWRIDEPRVVLVAFLVFEICCGVYFPCQGTLRGKYIPESSRSAIMNFFRIPLNLLVVVVLVRVKALENHVVFAIIVVWLLCALSLQTIIVRRRSETAKQSTGHSSH